MVTSRANYFWGIQMLSYSSIRNIAIIAHVDHGKTTLVDKLLRQSGTLSERNMHHERVMDSNALEQERGITILAKNTAILWKDTLINIVDTPGHADFGGEVERILSMVDSVLLLVDASEGPMPQTRFVTQKAFNYGLKPIVVINKIDRPGANPEEAINLVFDLFVKLGATDEQLDFPILYASALNGFAKLALNDPEENMHPLLDLLLEKVAPPKVDLAGPFQMQVSALDYSTYTGTIGIGRVQRGSIKSGSPIKVVDRHGAVRSAKIAQLFTFIGLEKEEVDLIKAGEIIAFNGIQPLFISDTLCDPEHVEALPSLKVDEPTMSMVFQVNDSPFAGKEGKFVTGRHLKDRLDRELIANVALRVEPGVTPDKFVVSGRGELHLSILIETMRREGYELSVSKPTVIYKEIDGQICEPYEELVTDVEEEDQGSVMQALAELKGDMQNMSHDQPGRVRMTYHIPTRGLIGFHTRFLTMTSGSGLMYHVFHHYAPKVSGDFKNRINGVLIANDKGQTTAYALFNLDSRGRMLVEPGVDVYEGMIIGVHKRGNDLVVNVSREKQLTNMRASGSDENIILTPPIKHSLEEALAFISDDELAEITPQHIRLRKKFLKEHERKKASRGSAD